MPRLCITIAALFLVFSLPACSCSDLKCGPGTHEEHGQCVPDILDDGSEEDVLWDDGPPDVLPDGEDIEEEEGETPAIEQVDWTTTRSDPLSAAPAGTVEGNLFGLPPSGFLLTDPDCSISFVESRICDYRWLDGALAETATVSAGMPIRVDRFISHDTSLMGLMTGTASVCSDWAGVPIYGGTVALIETATGSTRWTVPGIYANTWTDSFFTHMDGWAQPIYGTENPCAFDPPSLMGEVHYRSVDSPGTVLGPDVAGRDVVELPDGRWLTIKTAGTDERLFIMDPGAPEGAAMIYDGPTYNPLYMQIDGHTIQVELKASAATDEWQWLFYDIESGTHLLYDIPASNWVGAFSKSWIFFCEQGSTLPLVPCTAHDMTGASPDHTVQVVDESYAYALAGEIASLYYIGASGDVDPQPVLYHLDLETGEQIVLMEGGGRVVAAGGDAEAFLRTDADDLYLLRGPEAIPLEQGVVRWRTTSTARFPYPDVYGGLGLVPIVTTASLAAYGLSVFDQAAGRLYRLTENLYFDEGAWDSYRGRCESPGFAATMGFWGTQTHLYFTERDSATGDISIFLVPSDLSDPPALLATVPAGSCAAPLVSAAGDRAAVLVKEEGATSGTLYAAPLP
jgi:hypothetical protein